MGQGASSLVDCVCDGDIQSLKTCLQQRKQQYNRQQFMNSSNNDADLAQERLLEVEEAMHAVVGMEIHSGQQFQQLQIALEMLFQAEPRSWSSTSSNTIKWTAAHRACVTGNLSFLTFVFQQFDAFDTQERDAFGLFPIDLVPPELLRTPEEMASDALEEPQDNKHPIFPATARSRRNLALQILRQKKSEAEAQAIYQFVYHEHPTQMLSPPGQRKSDNGGDPEVIPAAEDNNAKLDTTSTSDLVDNQREERPEEETEREQIVPRGGYFIAFESCRDRLVPTTTSTLVGELHERSTPLRLKYRLPRVDEFLHGYFQLIWRYGGADHPRSEEPNYDTHVLMRDEMFLDQQHPCVDAFADALHLQEEDTDIKAARRNASLCRQLEDSDPVLQGCFPFDVSHLPNDAVCHVLFVACDKHLMKRTVVLSTEGIALRDANDGYDFLSPFNYLEGDDNEDFDDEDNEDEEDGNVVNGHIFHVAGEPFAHPNAAFAGKTFTGIEDFEHFVKSLRAKSKSNSNEKLQSQNGDDDNAQVKSDAKREADEAEPAKSEEEVRASTSEVSLTPDCPQEEDNQREHGQLLQKDEDAHQEGEGESFAS